MPRTTDPNGFGDSFAELLILMSERRKSIKLEAQNSQAVRLDFYAFRRAWRFQMDKAMKQKDLVVHASCKANYDALARYQCFAYQGFVEWVHQSQFVGAFQASEEVVEDMPMFSGFDLGGPSDTPQTKDLRSKGVDLSSFFDDGRTPRNLEHMKNSLLAALQTAKTYGIPGDVEAAQTELDQFLRENPTLL